MTETKKTTEKENFVIKDESPKPRKLSRPKSEKKEVKKNIMEEKKPAERASNDPRNR
jgi:hypothetical protein